MSQQQHGLGRGLASLIPPKITPTEAGTAVPIPKKAAPATVLRPADAVPGVPAAVDTVHGQSVLEVAVGKILPNPHQPRVDFSEDRLSELAESIREHGIIQPLIVTRRGESFELIAGERRLQAAKRAGLDTVPVVVREAEEEDKFELAIIENIQRHDLNALEEARAYRRLIDEFHLTQEEVARKMGKSRSLIANTLRLLQLPVEVQRSLQEGVISEGHARAVLSVAGTEKQLALFEAIVRENLTVREAEARSRTVTPKTYNRIVVADPAAKQAEEKLMSLLGTRVRVARAGKGGRITIEYYGPDDLDRLMEKLSGREV